MIFNTYDENTSHDIYLTELLNVAFEYESIVEIDDTGTEVYTWSSRSVNGLKAKIDRVGPQASCSRKVNGVHLSTFWYDFYMSDDGTKSFGRISDAYVSLGEGVRLVVEEMKILEHLALYLTQINNHGFSIRSMQEGPGIINLESSTEGWIEFNTSFTEDEEGNNSCIKLDFRGDEQRAREILAGAFGSMYASDK